MSDEIVFSAKYGDWIAIRKMTIDERTPRQEVVAMLAAIRETIDRKAFQLAGVDTARIDGYVAEKTRGKRKGYGTLAEIFASISQSELKGVLASAVPEERLTPLAEAYFLKQLFSSLGFDFGVSTELMRKLYPELKLPMPKGRIPGTKKAPPAIRA